MKFKRKKQTKKQSTFFNIPTWQEDEWQDMPEFLQEDQLPFCAVKVNFKSKEDMQAFAELIGQRISPKTQAIWYPRIKREDLKSKLYVDDK